MNNDNIFGYVHSFESFGSVDGPGVRFVIFLSGCAMRCKFCHNPDTWKMSSGTKYTVDEILKKATQYKSYWRNKGGITVSGGEPLLQIDFLTELFKSAKLQGINTVLDTSGNPFTLNSPFYEKFCILMNYTDLILLDIKHIDDNQHKQLTGYSNENILQMAQELSKMNKPIWIRNVLIPEINDKNEYLLRLREFANSLSNVQRIEVLPYHTLGVHKWEALGMEYQLKDISPPSKETIENAITILTK